MSNDNQQLQPYQQNGGDQLPELRQSGGANVQLQSLDDVIRLGKVLAHSGFYSDVKDASQAVVKVLAGAEYGLGPIASMRGVHCFDGQTTLHYTLVGALIKSSPKYDYRVVRSDEQGTEIAFFEQGEELGTATFTMKDAKRAGLDRKRNWKNYPTDMCFGRALTAGARRFCPDVFAGPVYTPEEIGGDKAPAKEGAQPPAEQQPVQSTPSKGEASRRMYDTADVQDAEIIEEDEPAGYPDDVWQKRMSGLQQHLAGLYEDDGADVPSLDDVKAMLEKPAKNGAVPTEDQLAQAEVIYQAMKSEQTRKAERAAEEEDADYDPPEDDLPF